MSRAVSSATPGNYRGLLGHEQLMENGHFSVALTCCRLTFPCSCHMTREKGKGESKLHCQHPFRMPERGLGGTEGWKGCVKGKGHKEPLLSRDVVLVLGAQEGLDVNFGPPVQFFRCAPVHNLPLKPDRCTHL